MELEKFLDSKPLYYKKFDPFRIKKAFELVKEAFGGFEIVHVVGTNGKGTTGRFLALMLRSAGYRVGHYTSPHILRFGERVWIDGFEAEDSLLDRAHREIYGLLGEEMARELSYFEYSTLVAAFCFRDCDYAVMEAGLGGEHDATSVFKKRLSVITPIDMDHMEFLVDSIESIAATKLKSVENIAVIGYQKHQEVWEVARRLQKESGVLFKNYEELLNRDTLIEIADVIEKSGFADYFAQNLALAAAAFGELEKKRAPIPKSMDLRGRFERVCENVIVDVGHNPAAARAIRDELKRDSKKAVLVYNSFKDKDYREVLKILAPVIKRVEILPICEERAVEEEILIKTVKELGFECDLFKGLGDEEYLVFGSFKVVEQFLKRYQGELRCRPKSTIF